jgi:hypothetical protein
MVYPPLLYDDPSTPAGNVPMDESMEVLDLNQVPELQEVKILNVFHSLYQHKDQEDYNELTNELDPNR